LKPLDRSTAAAIARRISGSTSRLVQHGMEIGVAFAQQSLLVGSEGRYPILNFLPHSKPRWRQRT
jgi:hypothetical protein